MRIKCPNSDIVLELPGDRTDMKFTCPACHKVHRVTVAITTPGEDPAPTPANAVAKSVPQMPKKYATGAYAPVVDIPIDANFVLVDASSGPSQQGIDLGKAARPAPESILDDALSARKTEIYNRRRDENADAVPDPGVNRADEPADEQPAADRREKTPPAESAAPRQAPPPFEPDFDSDPAQPGRERKSHALRNALIVLLAAVLGTGGYLGWQQAGFDKTAKMADEQLAWADAAWEKGDAAAAAAGAKKAGDTLREGEAFHTPRALWNRIAAAAGIVGASPSPTLEYEARIQKHLDRERALESFQDSLNAMDAQALASRLEEIKPAADGDALLGKALDKTAADAAIEHLEGASDGWTPEAARAHADAQRAILSPVLGDAVRADYENRVSSFNDVQRRRLTDQIKREINRLAVMADAGNGAAIEQYRSLADRIRHIDSPELAGPMPLLADKENQAVLTQLDNLSAIVGRAKRLARTVLSHDEEDDVYEVDPLIDEARAYAQPNAKLMDAAVKQIEDTTMVADDLLGLRIELYGRLQAELRRNRENPGTRMAWSLLRSAFNDPEMEIDPSGFKYDSNNAGMVFSIRGMPASVELKAADYEEEFRATVAGYRFKTGWANLFHKPLTWMADLAAGMRAAGVDSDLYPSWELLEGPGGPLALSLPGVADARAFGLVAAGAPRMAFFNKRLLPARSLPAPAGSKAYTDDFRAAAVRLEEAVMADESIPNSIRQALKPILQGTYQPPDPRDFFDSAFCRRLVEADYLETYIKPMPSAVANRLREYRIALGKLEAGYDEFSAQLPDGGGVLYGVNRLDRDISGAGKANDQDLDTGESIPRLTWRIEKDDETVFFSPQPVRFVYAFMLAERYPGKHKARPAGVPSVSEVWHATKGLVASYRNGDAAADGDVELWNKAIQEDESGRYDPTTGPPGWNYPLHVLQRDDQGDPVLLATLSGVVDCPDFSRIADPDARRRAEDEWLDHTAATLASPGELGLIFHQFFRYCSDSPLPELPNLIGSHYGLSDTHQTVYESLERRWVGRFIGDCDDLAEVFQVLTRRQGKLSHVMQLPGHAAAGYVEKIDDGEYRFVLLQTGPVMQFTAGSLPEVVETAYRAFDRGEGMSHMTTDAVPLLLRFADEQTRTPFVLSSRIYADADYAEKMIEVQSYWHEHVYSAALAMMEKMVDEDQEIGNIKELGSLYERVGSYDKSAAMRRRELEMVRNNPQQELSTLLEISQLHFQDKDKDKALESLGEMEDIMRRLIRLDDAPEFFRAMTFRSYWAMMMARLDQPERAWQLVRYDATMTKRQLGRIAEPVLRTMVVLYDRMRMQQEAHGGRLPEDQEKALDEVRRELDEAFGRGYFKSDDSYNNIINRYFVLGRYAVSDVGREEGLRRLRQDGPYPTAPKDQTRRTRGLDDVDWEWFRITPQLYLALGMEMLDEDEYPELYDPDAARPMLEDVSRAIDKGTGLGSDVAGGDDAVKAELTLAFLNNDIDAFRHAMAAVKEKNYSSLYDDAAMTFGLNCGFIPLREFAAWTEAFREFFPGKQHYFKVVYRALDKEHYDHALAMAEATARFFPDEELLVKEAEFVRSIIPGLKERKVLRRFPYL